VPTDTPAAFFSYCREDSEFALRLAEDLKAAGANVWMDQLDIEPGTPWDQAVENALGACPTMLVILSPISVKSNNVRDEVSYALSKQKRVIPVLYRDCDVPFRVARLQHIDFRADYDRGLKALLKVLGVSPPATSAAAVPAPDAGAHPALPDSGVRPFVSEPVEQRSEGERERQEQERRDAAEQVRLEEERKQAIERAHLEEQRQAAEKARLEEVERERQSAVEKARLEQQRKAAQEKASVVTLEPTEQWRSSLDQAESPNGVAPAAETSSNLSWRKIAIVVGGMAVLAFLVYRVAFLPTVASGWAVGGNTILHTEDGGRTWEQQNSGTDEPLWSVTSMLPQLAWVVGNGGTILHTENGGRTWQKQDSGTNERLNDVAFLTTQLGWAVGGPVILHTENGGRSWQQQSVDSPLWHQHKIGLPSQGLLAVTFVSSMEGWAVGADGVILHTIDGQSWHAQNSGIDAALAAITFVTPQSGWATGAHGTIVRTEDGGRTWQKQDSGVKGDAWLDSITFVTPQLGWVAVQELEGAGLLQTDDGGRTWRPNTGGPSYGMSVSFVSPQAGWVVDGARNILHTENGGRTWKQQKRVDFNLYSVAFVK
jgi:photosystem II stability/assembly factor-like uncharacterized protein